MINNTIEKMVIITEFITKQLIKEGDLLIIQEVLQKFSYVSFLLWKDRVNSFKSLLTLFNYNFLIIHQLSLNSYS